MTGTADRSSPTSVPDAGSRAYTGSVAWRQTRNNSHVLALQGIDDEEGAWRHSGSVIIDYFGCCAFRITTPRGLTLMFDPWRNDPSGVWGVWFVRDFPKIFVDVVVSTHAHFDHDAIDALEATSILDRVVGRWSFADVAVTGIADRHTTPPPDRYPGVHIPAHRDMVTYLVETGGIRVLIWGDNRPDPPEHVWRRWGQVDVLTLPVDDSEHILTHAQGDAIVERLKPKVVIPTHYLARGTLRPETSLRSAEGWVSKQNRKRSLETSRLTVDPQSLAVMDREFCYFGDQVAFA